MEPARIDWGRASVQDGTLTVPLTGDRPKGWKPSFERTVALLSAGAGKGNWDEVVLKAGKVKVTGLQAGGITSSPRRRSVSASVMRSPRSSE